MSRLYFIRICLNYAFTSRAASGLLNINQSIAVHYIIAINTYSEPLACQYMLMFPAALRAK